MKVISKIKEMNKQEWISFIGIFLITLGDYFCYSWMDSPYRYIFGVLFLVSGSLLLLIDVIKGIKNKEYNKKQLTIIGSLMIAGAFVWHKVPVFYTTIVIALHFLNKNLKTLFKYLFISMTIGMILIILMNLIGIIPDFVCYRQVGDGILKRHGLGFKHPNVIFKYFVAMVICGTICLEKNKLFLLGMLVTGVLLYFLTYSRMGLSVLCLLMLLCIIPKSIKQKICLNKNIPLVFVVGIVVTLLTGLVFNNNDLLNGMLSTRPSIWNVYIRNLGFFGKPSQINDLPLDNMYLHILYFGGIYGLIVYLAIYWFAFKDCNVKGNYNLFLIFIVSLAYGYIENFARQNEAMMLILLMIMLLDKNKMKELDENYECEKSLN